MNFVPHMTFRVNVPGNSSLQSYDELTTWAYFISIRRVCVVFPRSPKDWGRLWRRGRGGTLEPGLPEVGRRSSGAREGVLKGQPEPTAISSDIICWYSPWTLAAFRHLYELWVTDKVQGQICDHIFTPNVHYPSSIFRNACLFSHVRCLD